MSGSIGPHRPHARASAPRRACSTCRNFPRDTRIEHAGAGRPPLQLERRRPGCGPRGRIDEGDLVAHGVAPAACEALDQVQPRRRPARARLQVARLDNQRRAVPPAARVAHVHPDRRRQGRAARRSIERDDPRIVNQLVDDRDETRPLEDPHVGVVDRREHRIRKPSAVDDAADAEAVVLVRIARLATLQASARLRHGKRPGLRCSRRKTSIGRIDRRRTCAARSCCTRASAGSARWARPPCRRARRPAPDRPRRGPGRL